MSSVRQTVAPDGWGSGRRPGRSAGPAFLALVSLFILVGCDSLFEPERVDPEAIEAVIGTTAGGTEGALGVYVREDRRGQVRFVAGLIGNPGRSGRSLWDRGLIYDAVDRDDGAYLVSVDLNHLRVVDQVPRGDVRLPTDIQDARISPSRLAHIHPDTVLLAHWETPPEVFLGPIRVGLAVIDRTTWEAVDVVEPLRVSGGRILPTPPLPGHPRGLWVLQGHEGTGWTQNPDILFIDPVTREVVRRVGLDAAEPVAIDERRREVITVSLQGIHRISLLDGSTSLQPVPPGPIHAAVAPDDGEVFVVPSADTRSFQGAGLLFRYPPELGGEYELLADLRDAVPLDDSPTASPIITSIDVSGDGERVFIAARGHQQGGLMAHPAVFLVLDRHTGELLETHELGLLGSLWVEAL